ncbi:glycine zipper 2TM domain-containing protein [Lysobacter terrae]
MKRLFVSTLALGLAATTGLASAQSYRSSPYVDGYNRSGYEQDANVRYDYARVVRVDPVFDSRYGSDYGSYNRTSQSQRCYQRDTYVRGDGSNDGYNDGYYRNDGYQNDRYSNGSYANGSDGYYDQYGNYRRRSGGTQTGATVATVVGGLIGAAVGSQVGGGSARYATSAIGTMVGGMAGRQIYEQSQRQRDRVGTVTVCDPVPVGNGYSSNDRSVNAYDVTYEYAGHQYTTRTNYHPGDRIRVRVDVRAE